MDEPKQLNLTAMIGESRERAIQASHYAALLARHADSVEDKLVDDPPTRFLFEFGSENAETPPLAKQQFSVEVCRLSLLVMMAHWERYLLELNALRRVVRAFSGGKGLMKGEEFHSILATARVEARHSSLDRQLNDLEQSDNENVAAGTRWFRSLCAVRRCITHRAGIVGEEDADLIKGIAWRHIVVLRDGEPIPDVEREPKFERGQTLGLRFEDRSRSWVLGEHVVFSSLDIQEIALTLAMFAGILHDVLHADFVQMLGATSA